MATILCLETTTTNCSVAIGQEGALLVLKEDMGLNYSHSERLHVYIAKVLKEAKINQNDLDAIAVSKGPGSYTGLRIGVSSAKGLCFANDIPLIATDTLQCLGTQVQNASSDFIVPLLDARRMEVYSAIFDSEGERLRETLAEILDEHSFQEILSKGTTTFIGNGAAKFAEICSHPNAHFKTDALPSAREMTASAEAKYKDGDFEDLAYFEPFYLKDFVGSKAKPVSGLK